MTGRNVDDEAADPPLSAGFELRRQHLDVPVIQEVSLRVELAKAALTEDGKILPQ
jgi:hypothetical protein